MSALARTKYLLFSLVYYDENNVTLKLLAGVIGLTRRRNVSGRNIRSWLQSNFWVRSNSVLLAACLMNLDE